MSEKMKHKVLITDDDKFLLQMYSTKFANSGYEVISVQNSQDALDSLKDGFSPDIMLIDVVMPGMDGLELLKKVHEEKLAPNSVFIMLTNQSSPADIEKAKAAGIHGYIVKATTIPSEVVSEAEGIRANVMEKK
jgi:CheY-like chemotaxis protein